MKSHSLRRVASALRQYALPDIEVVASEDDADLVVLHVIGRCEQVTGYARELKARERNYAVIQYCVRSTQKPDTFYWTGTSNRFGLWDSARVVWSYYDLNVLMEEDHNGFSFQPGVEFYHAPLGAHSSVFFDRCNLNGSRPYLAMTHGQSWLTEGVREVVLATQYLKEYAFHLGPQVYRGERLKHAYNIDDEALATVYSQCQYVCPLRRIEGFELPAVEGLFCGARPILYDRPHYRQWYGNLAEYVEERPRPEVLEQLIQLFQKPYRRVTLQEIEEARYRFHWPRIITGFWERCLA